MISTYKDDGGRIVAYLEWKQVGQSGFDKLRGEYLWINDLWIHSDYKNHWEIYRKFMNEALFKAMDAKWMYFTRKKYGMRVSKLYSREKIMKLLERDSLSLIKELV